MGNWQAKNWDPAVGSVLFDEFCEALTQPLIGDSLNDREVMINSQGLSITPGVLNYAKYVRTVCGVIRTPGS